VRMAHHAHIIQGTKNTTYWTIWTTKKCCDSFKGIFNVLWLIKIDHIVAETKRYADYCIENYVLKVRSCMRSWQKVTSDVTYLVLSLMIPMGTEAKYTLQSYFNMNAFVETMILLQIWTNYEIFTFSWKQNNRHEYQSKKN
jgi:hypothetical protein